MTIELGRARRVIARLALVMGMGLGAAGCAEPPEPSPEQQAIFEQEVDRELVVAAVKNAMSYATPTVEAPAGATVRLVMDNSETTSPAMVHNVVVVDSEAAVERVGRAATGMPNNIPDDDAILVYTPLAGPGERTAVVFTVPPPGRYPFLCTYPGHFQFMQGTLISTPPN